MFCGISSLLVYVCLTAFLYTHSYAKEACGYWSADPHQHLEWSGLLKVHASWDHQGAAQSQSCSIQAKHEHHLWGQAHWAAVFALFTIFNSHCHYVHFVDFFVFAYTMVGGCLCKNSLFIVWTLFSVFSLPGLPVVLVPIQQQGRYWKRQRLWQLAREKRHWERTPESCRVPLCQQPKEEAEQIW